MVLDKRIWLLGGNSKIYPKNNNNNIDEVVSAINIWAVQEEVYKYLYKCLKSDGQKGL